MFGSRLAPATLLIVVCAACASNASNGADPEPAAPSTSAPTAPSSGPAGLAGYTEAEQAAYGEAVGAYDSFTARNDKIMAKGQTTVGAKDFYQKYAIDWSTAWTGLAQLANDGITVTGPTTAKWTRPKSIDLTAKGGPSVVLRRCLDETKRVVTQKGHSIQQPQFERPHVYAVTLRQKVGETWWRASVANRGSAC